MSLLERVTKDLRKLISGPVAPVAHITNEQKEMTRNAITIISGLAIVTAVLAVFFAALGPIRVA